MPERRWNRWYTLHSVFLLVTVLQFLAPARAEVVSFPQDDANCSAHVYIEDCFASSSGACFWCCEAPFGSQCKRPDEDCAADALLTRPWHTCGDLCRVVNGQPNTCSACETKNWCLFCRSSGRCEPPEAHCTDNAIVQRCDPPDSHDDDSDADPTRRGDDFAYIVTVSVVGLFLMAVSLAIIGLIEGRRRWRERREHQAREQRRALRREAAAQVQGRRGLSSAAAAPSPPQSSAAALLASALPVAEVDSLLLPEDIDERRPLLIADGEDELLLNSAPWQHRLSAGGNCSLETAEDAFAALPSRATSSLGDEAVCYLCLDARPTVTFLPCYHTCCCEPCSNRLQPTARDLACPFCRRGIRSMVSLRNVIFRKQDAGSR